MVTPILLFPFNGNALEALDCLGDAFELIGFVDDTPQKQGAHPEGFTVYGRDALIRFSDAQVLAVPGGPATFRKRLEIIHGLGVPSERFATVIHPAARVSRLARIGHNTLLMAGVVITSNAVIGDHVVILPNSVVHHDSSLGEGTLVGANVAIAGNVKVGSNCYVGTGTNVINGVEIGAGALIGLGSNVTRPVAAMATAFGNPAREKQ